MYRTLLLGLMVFSLCSCGGCTRDVHFGQHAPYSAPHRYKTPLVIVVPDGLEQDAEVIDAAFIPNPDKLRLHYGEAFKYEAIARFSGLFSDTAFVSESVLDEALAPEAADESDSFAAEVSPEEQEPSLLPVPSFVSDNRGYLLRFEELTFSMEDDRPTFVADVTLEDRFAAAELLRTRVVGRGGKPGSRATSSNATEELKKKTLEACAQMLTPLRQKVIEAIEAGPADNDQQPAPTE
ncbi:hypothetical protein HZA57_01195 [Candidatus Poribacteria bacterium]|nr:hypothetical protein [Candidatus Poribacteria bacterium]